MPSEATDPASITLPFDKFWMWLQAHRNCIVRAGTVYAVLVDHDDFHWEVVSEDQDTQVLQLVRGKNLVGEIVMLANEIAYVQSIPTEGDEQLFECYVETPESREIIYHFVMSHGYDDEPDVQNRRWTH